LCAFFVNTLLWRAVTFRNEGMDRGIRRKKKERNEERIPAVV
jgi:hypothetical protein